MKTIDRHDLQSRLAGPQPPILLEALPEHFFRQWHLPGAVNLNVDAVAARAPALLPDKAAAIVVYCASATCRNSHQVALQLAALGYSDVAVYPGGKADWDAAGLPKAA